jgi:hypothetical protein
MKSWLMKIAGLCLASTLAFGVALAGNASAAVPLWLLCLEGANAHNTKYKNNQCTEASSSGKWESVPLENKIDSVKIVFLSLRFVLEKESLGELAIQCSKATGGGLIESRNLLLIREARVTNPASECTVEDTLPFKTCKTSLLESTEPGNLPWLYEVYQETEHKFISRIRASEGQGEPEWTWRCADRGYTCVLTHEEGASEEFVNENVVTAETHTLLVLAGFVKKRKEGCEEVAGHLAILLSNGNGLSLKN